MPVILILTALTFCNVVTFADVTFRASSLPPDASPASCIKFTCPTPAVIVKLFPPITILLTAPLKLTFAPVCPPTVVSTLVSVYKVTLPSKSIKEPADV